MASLLSGALRRRLDVLTDSARREVGRRQELRERAEVWTILRTALDGAKIDPATISGLWPLSGAEAELRRCGDNPELQRADAAFIAQDAQLASRKRYAAGLPERARKFIGQPPPDPLHASVSDWCAWSMAVRSGQAAGVDGQPSPDASPASVSH